jgi:hypothetical protein
MGPTLRTTLFRNELLACAISAAALATAQAGCSSPEAPSPVGTSSTFGTTSSADNGGTGTANVTATWTLPGTEQITTLNWGLTHPESDAPQSGSVAVSSDPAVFLIGSLDASAMYQLTVSGTSTDGATVCTGSVGPFKVMNNKTTNVSVTLACRSAFPDAGYVQVNGSAFNCATLSFVTVLPAEVTVGHSVALNASATGLNPAALTYAWSASAPGGMFSAPNSASTTFTCTAAGTVPVTLRVSDGPLPDGGACDPAKTSATVSVTCD